MDGMHDGTLLTDAAALRALYGEPSDGGDRQGDRPCAIRIIAR